MTRLLVIALIGFSSIASASNDTSSWSQRIYGRGSGYSKYSAQFDAESQVRYQLNRYRYICDSDAGDFSHSYINVNLCRNYGSRWTCEGTAIAYCYME